MRGLFQFLLIQIDLNLFILNLFILFKSNNYNIPNLSQNVKISIVVIS